MARIRFVLGIPSLLAGLALVAVPGCLSSSDDGGGDDGGGGTPPGAPQDALGFVARMDDASENADMLLIWDAATGDDPAIGYHVERTIGDGDWTRLTTSAIVARPLTPGSRGTRAGGDFLWWLDTALDESSSALHRYRIVAVDAEGEEGAPSETIELVPALVTNRPNVTGMSPADTTDIGLAPTLSWSPLAGTETWFVYLMTGGNWSSDDTEAFSWARRLPAGTTSATLTAGGTVLLDDLAGTLAADRWYFWGVFAVDAHNVGFADQETRFFTGPNPIVRTLVEQYVAPGQYQVVWDQRDEDGAAVAEGSWRAMLFVPDEAMRFWHDFAIAAPPGPDGAGRGRPADRPLEDWSIRTDAATYAPGDPVTISYEVAITTDVLVWIEPTPAGTGSGR